MYNSSKPQLTYVIQHTTTHLEDVDILSVVNSAPGVVMGLGQQVTGSGEEQGLCADGQEGGEGAGVSSRHHQ